MSEAPSRKKNRRNRKLAFESLESRRVMTLPYGASPADLGEFMLGRIAVTPVFLESDGRVDTSTEDWTPAHITAVMNNIQTGLNWWNQLLATKSSVHTFEWVIDRTYVDSLPKTPYEPINRNSNAYTLWVGQFLSDVGFNQSTDLDTNMRAFNQSQRVKLNTDWAFTMFVIDAKNDGDGSFAPGGSFSRAFAFAGGLYNIIPSTRPPSTYAHETGHIFWARDEYSGGSNYYQQRGYYDAQNTNAVDLNPNPNFQQQPSIMSSGGVLDTAYNQVISPDATLAQIGWRDSDGDGIFDVLDVPLKLEGTGRFDASSSKYKFVGKASTQTLPNRNSSGLQNDITLNRIGRIEYRINNGAWTTLSTPEQYTVDLNLNIPIPPTVTTGIIDIRAIDPRIGITSNVFSGSIGDFPDTTTAGGIQGFAWNDLDKNGQWAATESGLAGLSVTLVDTNNQPLQFQKSIDPDNYPLGTLTGNLNGARVDVIGEDTTGAIGVFEDQNASTGKRIFKPYALGAQRYVDAFNDSAQQMRVRFDTPTSYVAIDAIAVGDNTNVRLDAYGSDGKLITRFEQRGLIANQKVTMEVGTGNATIAYVVARGFQGSYVKFDNVKFGPSSTATTASDGSYAIRNIPAGTYSVLVSSATPGLIGSNPSTGLRSVVLSANGQLTHVDFGVYRERSPWQNPAKFEDVDNSNSIDPLDVLVLINEINRNGSRPLDGSGLTTPPYYDVDGDRNLSPLDVLIVINTINRNFASPRAGSGEGESAAPSVTFDSVHNGQTPFRSFVFDTKPDAPTTWIVSSSNAYQLKPSGPDKCGCPTCTAVLASYNGTASKKTVTPTLPVESELSPASLDEYFAQF